MVEKGKDRRRLVASVKEERRRGDRRSEQRVPVDLWVEAEEGEDLYFQRAGNLSAGGAYFTQTVPHPVGTRVRLRFSLPGAPNEIACHGEIVAATGADGPGMNVKFLDLSPEHQRRIRDLASKLPKR